jgi:hypothetical protein
MEGMFHQSLDEEGNQPEGVPCLILRTTCRTGCIIQIQETGATVEIELNTPLDLSRACLICATHPVSATIKLGHLKGHVFKDCELLEVNWPKQQEFAPPMRFQRKKRLTRTEGGNPMQGIVYGM